MPSKHPKPILAYSPGPLPVGGAFTVDVVVPPGPLQPVIDAQYIDSKTMSLRSGMYLKYLHYLYASVSRKLLTGGCSAFDTHENAKEYERWTEEDCEVGEEGKKIKFWEQPMFESHRGRSWRIVGAHAFVRMEEHVCMRLAQWKYQGDDAETALIERFPTLRDEFGKRGGAAIWLLHDPDDKMVGMQLVFKKGPGDVDESFAEKTLADAAAQPSFEHHLPKGLDLERVYDRTSLLLTVWLPRSRAAGGAELHIPLLSSLVPDITHEYE